MVEHQCDRCGYTTRIRNNLRMHLERKVPCKPILSTKTQEELLEVLNNKEVEYTMFECHHCYKRNKSRQALYYHKKVCKANKPICQNQRESHTAAIPKPYQREQRERTDSSHIIFDLEHKCRLLEAEVLLHKNKKNELFFQTVLELIHQGTHKKLACGVTDITTDDMHAEIKEWNCWKEALGQLIAYNTEDPKPIKRVYCFGKYSNKMKEIAVKVLHASGIETYECDVEANEVRFTKYGNSQPSFSHIIDKSHT